MNEKTLKALDRLLATMERRARRPRRRFTATPLVLAAGLVLGDLLLIKFVPMAWSSLLPGGLEQAGHLRGWPGLVWQAALFCHARQARVQTAIVVVSVVMLLVTCWVRPLRFVAWLATVGVIVIDAGIVFVTLQTSFRATVDASGLGLG